MEARYESFVAAADRRGAAAGAEEDFLLQARLVDLLPGHRAGGDHAAALVVRTPPRGRTSPHAGRRQHDLRGPVPFLLSARDHLFRLHGNFLEPVPWGDAGEDPALLLPDAHAAGTAGGGQVPGGPGGGPDVICGQHGGGIPDVEPALRPGVERLLVPRPGPEPAWQLYAGGGARLRRLRRGIPDVRVVVSKSADSGGGGFRVGKPEPVPAGPAEEDQHHFLPEEPVPGRSPGAAAILRDGGRIRPNAHVDRRARTAGGCGDPADLLGHLRAANGNQLRRVATPGGLTGDRKSRVPTEWGGQFWPQPALAGFRCCPVRPATSRPLHFFMKFRGRGPSAPDERVCPTLARKRSEDRRV